MGINQIYENVELYSQYIQAIASLSGLFSESTIPFLHYRVVENIFCKSFKADNLSRADIAYDAKIGTTGIGLKTFISNGASREKIAEFNNYSRELHSLLPEVLVIKLSQLRNERIDFANRTYAITQGIYHCVTREENTIKIFESDYSPIHIKNIANIDKKKNQTSIFFADGIHEYSYNFSKSTLYRKFYTPADPYIIPVKVIKDPYDLILNMHNQFSAVKEQEIEEVILPLYSTKANKKIVPEKSGLNHWNAGGRKRDIGEVYIPIPIKIHQLFPTFFPSKDTAFTLILPNKSTLSVKVCQENGKALMSNPNKALSYWLLRDVLKREEGEVITYNHLKILEIDSVKITKIHKNGKYSFTIDFVKINSYEEFIKKASQIEVSY